MLVSGGGGRGIGSGCRGALTHLVTHGTHTHTRAHSHNITHVLLSPCSLWGCLALALPRTWRACGRGCSCTCPGRRQGGASGLHWRPSWGCAERVGWEAARGQEAHTGIQTYNIQAHIHHTTLHTYPCTKHCSTLSHPAHPPTHTQALLCAEQSHSALSHTSTSRHPPLARSTRACALATPSSGTPCCSTARTCSAHSSRAALGGRRGLQ